MNHLQVFFSIVGNGLQLRNVGLFGALSCPPVTKVAMKNEPCGKPLTAPCFLRCC